MPCGGAGVACLRIGTRGSATWVGCRGPGVGGGCPCVLRRGARICGVRAGGAGRRGVGWWVGWRGSLLEAGRSWREAVWRPWHRAREGGGAWEHLPPWCLPWSRRASHPWAACRTGGGSGGVCACPCAWLVAGHPVALHEAVDRLQPPRRRPRCRRRRRWRRQPPVSRPRHWVVISKKVQQRSHLGRLWCWGRGRFGWGSCDAGAAAVGNGGSHLELDGGAGLA